MTMIDHDTDDDIFDRQDDEPDSDDYDISKTNRHEYIKFVNDMRAAGFPVTSLELKYKENYPVVYAYRNHKSHELQDVIRATSQRVRFEILGLDWIVYPQKD
jgi:hypothetical protein